MKIKKYGMPSGIPFFIGMAVLIFVIAGFGYKRMDDSAIRTKVNIIRTNEETIKTNDKTVETNNMIAKCQGNNDQSKETEQKRNLDRQEEISRQVLRFHIRAVSDKEEDQSLKLKVKTQVVNYLQWLLADCRSKESCEEKIEENLDFIEKMAASICQKAGKPTEVRAYLTREKFPLKQYGDMIFPSGIYDALRVDLGTAKGKNWWCMMYPSLCMVDGVVEEVPAESKEELKKNLSEEAYDSLFWKTKQKKQNSKGTMEEGNQDANVAMEEENQDANVAMKEKNQDANRGIENDKKETDNSEETLETVQYHIKWKAAEIIRDYLGTNSSR